jgi:hypothetical protein
METARSTNLGLEYTKGSTKNRVIASIAGFLAIGGSLSPSLAEASPAQEPISINTNTESLASTALVAKTKKKKLSCKKINKVRKSYARPLKKKEKKYLKKKCGIKYPNIYGSTKNTKVFGSIAYNWGPEPKDTGGLRPADETNFEFTSLIQTKFDLNGKPIAQKAGSSSQYYKYNTGYSKDAYEFDQPTVSKKSDKYDYGVLLRYVAENNSDEVRGLTVSLKDYPSTSNIFVDSSITLQPGNSAELIISDSVDQPLSQYGYNILTGQQGVVSQGDERNLYIFSPDRVKSSEMKDITRAILKICVTSDNPQEHCYTRAVVTGKSNIFD